MQESFEHLFQPKKPEKGSKSDGGPSEHKGQVIKDDRKPKPKPTPKPKPKGGKKG